jgi:Rv2632c-like
MASVKRWTVDIYIDEHAEERRTYAEARLHTGDPTDVRGVGTSWRHPRDVEIPEIGDELAAARALEELAAKLRIVAADDITAVTAEASRGW